jgi:hypothetical protein
LGSRSLNALPIFLDITFKLSPKSNIHPPFFIGNRLLLPGHDPAQFTPDYVSTFLQFNKVVFRDLNLSFAPEITKYLLLKSTNLTTFLSRGILPLYSHYGNPNYSVE